MLICHKLLASNGAAVLQACHMSDMHATLAVTIIPASREVVCRWAPHPVLSITAGFQTPSLGSYASPPRPLHEAVIFFFCSMYLLLFSIVLHRTIITVYTDNIFLNNYLHQMHQICLSPIPWKCEKPMLIWYLYYKCGWLGNGQLSVPNGN